MPSKHSPGGCRTSGRALQHEIRSGGPWPPKSDTAPPGARRAIPRHEPPTGRRASPRLRPRAVAFAREPGTRRPAVSVSRRQEPGPLRPENRHTHVVATNWAGVRQFDRVAGVLALAGGFLRMSPDRSRSARCLRHATFRRVRHEHLRSGNPSIARSEGFSLWRCTRCQWLLSSFAGTSAISSGATRLPERVTGRKSCSGSALEPTPHCADSPGRGSRRFDRNA